MTSLFHAVIRKQLKAFQLEVELGLDANQGQVLVLFGPSGSGKTMTLKCIAGIAEPDAGFVSIGPRTVFDSHQRLNVRLSERKVGYLPQNYALFPHLTVNQNIAFGLSRWDRGRANRRLNELVRLMQLEGLEKRYPRELSGGQQQRVAFARALAPQPEILLLDEPFAALDTNIRAELRQNLALLSRDLGLPVVFITHDLEEAYMLADRIAVYDQGHVLQCDTRTEVFYHPTSVQTAQLLGIKNLWEGRVLEANMAQRLVLVRTAHADVWASVRPSQFLPPSNFKVTLSMRPENIKIWPMSAKLDSPNCYSGHVTGEVARGSRYTLFFNLGEALSQAEHDLEIEVTAQEYAAMGQQQSTSNIWQISLDPAAIHLIAA